MSYFLAIALATIGGCLIGIFGTHVYYSFYTDDAEHDFYDDEDLWK